MSVVLGHKLFLSFCSSQVWRVKTVESLQLRGCDFRNNIFTRPPSHSQNVIHFRFELTESSALENDTFRFFRFSANFMTALWAVGWVDQLLVSCFGYKKRYITRCVAAFFSYRATSGL